MVAKMFIEELFTYAEKKESTYTKIVCITTENNSFDIIDNKENNIVISNVKGIYVMIEIGGCQGCAYTENWESPQKLIDIAIENMYLRDWVNQRNAKMCFYHQPQIKHQLLDLSLGKKILLAKELIKEVEDRKVEGVRVLSVSSITRKKCIEVIDSKGTNIKQYYNNATMLLKLLIAKNGKKYASTGRLSLTKKLNLKECVSDAIEQGIFMINATSIQTQYYDIIILNKVMAKFVKEIAFIFMADKAEIGLSKLKNKEGSNIAAKKISISDNPNLKFNCREYDEEGVKTYKKRVVEKGKLITLLYNMKQAEKCNCVSTGNGFSLGKNNEMGINPINFHIENGVKSYDELEKSLKKGVVITELFGYRSGLNVTSGFFSLRAQGYYKRDQKKEPIEQIIFSGNIYDVLLMVEEIADDLYFEMINGAGYGSPSIMLRRQLIIGKGEMR